MATETATPVTPAPPQAAAQAAAHPAGEPSSPHAAPRRVWPVPGVGQGWLEVGTLTTLAALTILAEWPLLNGRLIAGLDSLTQFYPWYELLGSRLAEGALPGWNPYSFAGAPLAANPLTGWTYLPVMLLFSTLPLPTAAVSFHLFHVLLAAIGSYALARALGLGRLGALFVGVAYSQSGLVTLQSACCFAFSSVGAWLPLLLLGGEVAIRAHEWRWRVRGWALAAVALSQIAASWPGQGTYYALVFIGLYVGGRALLLVRRRHSLRDLAWIAPNGALPVALGLALAAAGLLPRVEFQMLSSLADGYAAEDLNVGGWTVPEWSQLIEPGFWYAGLVVAALAVAAPLVAWRWRPAWLLLPLGALLLGLAMPTPNSLSDLFGLLPGFGRLHPHLPDRIMTVFMLIPALLAGAAVQRLPRGRLGTVLGVLLLLATFADLRLAREQGFLGYGGVAGVHRLLPVDLAAYYAPSPAAQFLQDQLRTSGPARYFGYHPVASGLAYTQRYDDPATVRIGANNRGVSDRLLDLQGYDAIHLARFDAWLREANGKEQNYHNADVFAEGLRSPLLDMLAARYVVTPSAQAGTDADARVSDPALVSVFDDGTTRVLENREALPWAWVVHQSRPASAQDARTLIQSDAVDPRETVLLEPPLVSPLLEGVQRVIRGTADDASAPPSLESKPGAVVGEASATVVRFEPDRLVVVASTDQPAILVLSEVAYPGWQATVDGRPTPVYVANGLLRAVALPTGEHTVTLRFQSDAILLGIGISLATLLLLAVAVGATVVPRRSRTILPKGA